MTSVDGTGNAHSPSAPFVISKWPTLHYDIFRHIVEMTYSSDSSDQTSQIFTITINTPDPKPPHSVPQTLLALSLVCRAWRESTLPNIFRRVEPLTVKSMHSLVSALRTNPALRSFVTQLIFPNLSWINPVTNTGVWDRTFPYSPTSIGPADIQFRERYP